RSRSSRDFSWPSTSGACARTAESPVRYRTAHPEGLMHFLKNIINTLSDPTFLLPIAAVIFLISLRRPAFWTKKGGLIALALVTGFMAVSLFDPNFRIIVTKPDNVPIVSLIFLVGFFTWLAMHQAFENDRRVGEGKLPLEKDTAGDKVWVWPDLVYTELISMV